MNLSIRWYPDVTPQMMHPKAALPAFQNSTVEGPRNEAHDKKLISAYEAELDYKKELWSAEMALLITIKRRQSNMKLPHRDLPPIWKSSYCSRS